MILWRRRCAVAVAIAHLHSGERTHFRCRLSFYTELVYIYLSMNTNLRLKKHKNCVYDIRWISVSLVIFVYFFISHIVISMKQMGIYVEIGVQFCIEITLKLWICNQKKIKQNKNELKRPE